MAPQLSRGWGHNYSTKTKPTGRTNEQSIYSLMSMLTRQSLDVVWVEYSTAGLAALL